jgi:methylmalonyl-CoA/ethylmalonyl-CoA epimerase
VETDMRVHHVAIAVNDIDTALGFFRKSFAFEVGVEKRRSFTGEFNWCNFYIGQFRVELIEGARPNSFVHRFIETRGEGFHHISFKVTQLERLVAQLEADGIRVVDRYTAADGSMTASISPRSAHGVLMQFWQMPPEPEPTRPRVAPLRLRSGEIIHMRVDHVSVAVQSIDTALGFFRRYFPVGTVGKTTTGYDPTFRFTQFLLNDYKMEVITQNDRRPPGFVARFLERRGEGFHHLSIDVDRLGPLLSQFEADGVQIVGRNEAAGVGKTAFISPRSAHGVLIQFWETSNFDGPSVFTGGQYRG